MENSFNFKAMTTDGIEVTAEVKETNIWPEGRIFVNGKLWFKFDEPNFLDALDAVMNILYRIDFE